MDIDTNAVSSKGSTPGGIPQRPPPVDDKTIKIHPLAIIGISDHHTRIVTGGSALAPEAPVVGLLFGYQDGSTIVIVDAEEMEYPKILTSSSSTSEGAAPEGDDDRAAVRKKIELHQKVFPRHVVVGWYRVQRNIQGSTSSDDYENIPSESDLRMNQTEMSQYCDTFESPLFVLMNASSSESQSDNNKKSSTGEASLELDEQLPLSVYETLVTEGGGSGGSAVFVNVDFELETYEPERIAVEKVFKTQPSQSRVQSKPSESAASESAELRKSSKKSKKDEKDSSCLASAERNQLPSSELDVQLDSLQSSIRSMNARMTVLLEFLQKVKKGELSPDDALLRNVDGLLQQWPLVLGSLEEASAPYSSSSCTGRRPLQELENEYNDTMLLSYLAAVAKTAKTVHVYSEKFRAAFETNNNRDIRRSAF